MNNSTASSKLASIFKEYWIPIVIGSLGLICLGYGLIYLFGSSSNTNEIVFEAKDDSRESLKKIMVDVEGAVLNPGVYSLSEDSRIQDALVLAGGLSADANREWIAKSLNLAAKLSDATKIYIPSTNESFNLENTSLTENSLGITSKQININTANESELDTLYGVGPATAKKIIDNRPYSEINDLLSKNVVSSKVYEQIKDDITTY